MAGSHDNSMSNFLRSHHNVFHGNETILQQSSMECIFWHILYSFGILKLGVVKSIIMSICGF